MTALSKEVRWEIERGQLENEKVILALSGDRFCVNPMSRDLRVATDERQGR